MLFCAWLLRRKGLRAVLAFGIGGTFLKLAGTALAGEAWQYMAALALHGCFFSGALTGFTVWLDRVYKSQDRPSLQALAPVFYAGLPAALSGLTAGLVWQHHSLRAVYLLAGVVSAGAAVYAFILLRDRAGEPGEAPIP
jgi:MFS family permease